MPSRSGSPRSSTTTSGCQSTTAPEGVRTAALGADGVAVVGQGARDRLADPLIVLDHEHRCHRADDTTTPRGVPSGRTALTKA